MGYTFPSYPPSPPRLQIGRIIPDRRVSHRGRHSLPRRGRGEKLREPPPSSAAAGESRIQQSGREHGKERAKGRGRWHCCCQETTDRCSSPSTDVPSRRILAPPRGSCSRSTRGPQGSRNRNRNIPEFQGRGFSECRDRDRDRDWTVPSPPSAAISPFRSRSGQDVVIVGRRLLLHLLLPEDRN